MPFRRNYRGAPRGATEAGGVCVNGCFNLVGAGRFERPTPCAQGRCATRLRYAPTGVNLFHSIADGGPLCR